MADNIKIKDLPDTSSVQMTNKIMVLVDNTNNEVNNISISDFLSNTISTTANNAIVKDNNDDKLYAFDATTITGQLTDLTTSDKSSLVNAINELNSPLNNDFINNSKALTTGTISDDSTLYDKIHGYAYSNFDASKFTKTGSPAITSDGIMSNISATNYVTIDTSNIIYKSSLELILPIKRETLGSAQWFESNSVNAPSGGGFWLGFTATNELRFFASSGTGSTWDIASDKRSSYQFSGTSKYYIKIVFTGTQYLLYYSQDKKTWTALTEMTVNSSTIAPITNGIRLGFGSSSSYFHGLYYLAEVSIKADGYPAFYGVKTGVDTIKPVNYTKVGSLTISDDGIASNFSASNYITCPSIDVTGKSFEIDLGKIYIADPTQTQFFLSGQNDDAFSVYVAGSSQVLALRLSNSDFVNSAVLSANTYYYVKAGFDGINIYLKTSTDGESYITYTTATTQTFTTMLLKIGIRYNDITPCVTSINLNAIKVYAENELIYQPCLKIAYMLSKTGSKLTDVSIRDSVEDEYTQFGNAPYYTIDENNLNFTLPMGELYGFISKLMPLTSYKNGIDFWELYQSKKLIQGGSCTSGTAVTLLKDYSDTNYILSVPYSAKSATGFTPSQTGDWFAIGYVN